MVIFQPKAGILIYMGILIYNTGKGIKRELYNKVKEG